MSRRFPFLAIILILATALPIPASAADPCAASQYWELTTLLSTVIFDGRPAGLLTVVPVVDMGSGEKVCKAKEQALIVQDHLLLGLNRFSTMGFDPRTPIDILAIKKILQEELDKVLGAGKSTLYITSAHVARRKN